MFHFQTMRTLTNLENVLLAQLFHRQECTAHELRRNFAESSSARYSGSAGAIYPTIRRLESFGLVASRPDSRGRQSRRLYRITQSGRAAMRDWLLDLKPGETFADDPIRTRFQYLSAFSRDEQLGWLQRADATLARQADMVQAEYADPAYRTDIDTLVRDEVLASIRLRRRRLALARQHIEQYGALERTTPD